MESALFLLDKKFAQSWASWSVVASMNQNSIDQVINGFDRLDKKTKIRFIIALLGLDSARRNALAGSIRRLLGLAFDSSEEWVPIIASIVYSRLLPGESDLGQQRAGRVTEEGAQEVVDRIAEALADRAGPEGREFQYFRPLGHKFLARSDSDSATQAGPQPFSYVGSRPDFLLRERNAQKALAQDTKRGSSVLSSRVAASRLFAPDRPDPEQSLRRSVGSGGSLLPSKPLFKPAVEHKAPIMLPFSQTKELEAAHNLQKKQQLKKRTSDAAEQPAAKKLKPAPAPEETPKAPAEEKKPVAKDKASAPPASSGPDLDTLFAQSPLLTADDKATIEKFFGETWRNHFTDRDAVLKFRLKEEDKTKDGVPVKETIFLNLTCSNHSWSKTKRSTKAILPQST